MKTKIISITFVMLFLFLPSKLDAVSVLEAGETQTDVTADTEICANQEYELYDKGNEKYANIYIYDQDNYLLEEYQTNQEMTTIVIPNELEHVKIRMYSEETNELKFEIEYDVKDCGLEEIKASYGTNKLKAGVTVSNSTITLTPPANYNNYNLKYKTSDMSKVVTVNGETNIKVSEYPFVVQFNESYKGDDMQTISLFYELYISDKGQYSIREINGLDITAQGLDSMSSRYYYILAIVFIGFLFFRKQEKKYKRKLKRLKEKKRGKVPKKKQKSSNNDSNSEGKITSKRTHRGK